MNIGDNYHKFSTQLRKNLSELKVKTCIPSVKFMFWILIFFSACMYAQLHAHSWSSYLIIDILLVSHAYDMQCHAIVDMCIHKSVCQWLQTRIHMIPFLVKWKINFELTQVVCHILLSALQIDNTIACTWLQEEIYRNK